jgi:hypothetical protein
VLVCCEVLPQHNLHLTLVVMVMSHQVTQGNQKEVKQRKEVGGQPKVGNVGGWAGKLPFLPSVNHRL